MGRHTKLTLIRQVNFLQLIFAHTLRLFKLTQTCVSMAAKQLSELGLGKPQKKFFS